MPTKWFYPNNVAQSAEDAEHHIPWTGQDQGFYAIKSEVYDFIGTARPLLHIANPTVNDLRMRTYYLSLTQFNMNDLPNTIAGLEANINMQRGGRITDDTIQLIWNEETISENLATSSLENSKLFGGSDILWGVNLTKNMLEDPNFGIKIRFQSHPYWPHRETPMINYVRLRVY